MLNDKGVIEIDNVKYYYKKNNSYVELLSEKIADLFNIEHANYKTIKFDGIDYYISEDLNNKGLFKTAYEADIHSFYIDNIIKLITEKYYKDSKELIDDLIKLYFMDIIILLIDRHSDNWGFLEKNNRTKICILDNELAFIDTHTTLRSVKDTYYFNNSILEVNNIYNSFPQYYIDLFNDMLDTLDHSKLLELIKLTEMQINKTLPNKENYIMRFDNLRSQIDNLRKEKTKTLKKIHFD